MLIAMLVKERTKTMAQRMTGKILFVPNLTDAEITYPRMLATIQDLGDMGQHWFQSRLRSQPEQELMLHHIRCLLTEIESGYIENLPERFQQASNEVSALSNNYEEVE